MVKGETLLATKSRFHQHARRVDGAEMTGCPPRKNLRTTPPARRRVDRLVLPPGLLLAVLFGMSLHGLFSMPSAMNYVAPRGVSMVCRLFVVSGIVVFGGLLVVTGGMFEMF